MVRPAPSSRAAPNTASVWRRIEACDSLPAANSTTNAVVPGKVAFPPTCRATGVSDQLERGQTDLSRVVAFHVRITA